MKGFQIYALSLFVSSFFMSCRTTAILSANFESYTVGTLPAHNLPGDPVGDEITYSTELEPRIRIVASGSNKALNFSQAVASDLTAHNQFIGFKGISTNLAEPLWFLFTAVHSGNGGALTIDIADGAAGLIARMFISQSGNVSVIRSLPGEEQNIGNVPPDVSHTCVFSLNMAEGKYNLTIIKSGGNLTATDLPVLAAPLEYANPARPTIYMRYDNGDAPDRKYVLEAVSISRKAP
jgi:hypothetical protein